MVELLKVEPLSKETLEGIVVKFIEELNSELKEKKIKVTLNRDAITFIAQSASSQDMGARPLKRFIQDNITKNSATL